MPCKMLERPQRNWKTVSYPGRTQMYPIVLKNVYSLRISSTKAVSRSSPMSLYFSFSATSSSAHFLSWLVLTTSKIILHFHVHTDIIKYLFDFLLQVKFWSELVSAQCKRSFKKINEDAYAHDCCYSEAMRRRCYLSFSFFEDNTCCFFFILQNTCFEFLKNKSSKMGKSLLI